MTTSFSLYLDLIRFLASVAVFIAHISTTPFSKDVIWHYLGEYGSQSVTIFFVLSGYVIAFVSSTSENTLKKYISARVSRLYSVVLIALILTYIFDIIGMSINPEFYTIKKVLWKPESLSGYMSAIFFLNEYQVFKFNGISPGTNGPYWSLSFEATYYLIAGFVLFSRKLIWIPVSILVFFLAGKTIIALFPIWLLGYFLFHFRCKFIFNSLICSITGFLITIVLILASKKIASYMSGSSYFWLPWGRGPFNRDIILDYFVAFFFSRNLVCAHNIFNRLLIFSPLKAA